MTVAMTGGAQITLTRDAGEVGIVTAYFEVQAAYNGQIISGNVTAILLSSEDSITLDPVIVGITKYLGEGQYVYGLRVLRNLGGNNMPQIGDTEVGNFRIEK